MVCPNVNESKRNRPRTMVAFGVGARAWWRNNSGIDARVLLAQFTFYSAYCPPYLIKEHTTKMLDETTKPIGTRSVRKRNAVSKADADHASKDDAQAVSSPRKKRRASPKKEDEEKRLRRFRAKAPDSYLEKLHRATTQRSVTFTRVQRKKPDGKARMFVIDRTRGGTDDIPEETIDMAGTTGNIYSITISQIPSCTCPDNQKGNQCKHIIYVSSRATTSRQSSSLIPIKRSYTMSSKPPNTFNTN